MQALLAVLLDPAFNGADLVYVIILTGIALWCFVPPRSADREDADG